MISITTLAKSPAKSPVSRSRLPRIRTPLLAAAALLAVVVVRGDVTRPALAQSAPPAPVHAEPQRIVAVGGAVTEILYALGKEDLVAAVDTTSLFPPRALRDKPNVGYVRALSAEGVLSIRPTLVIAIEGAGPPDSIRLLAEAGVRMARVPDEASEAGVMAKIEAVSQLVNGGAYAPALLAKTREGFARLATERAQVSRPLRILFVLALQNGRPMVGGGNSAADAIIRLAGGINAAARVEGYKPMTDEAVIDAAPDVILMMNRGNHATPAAEVFALPAFSATPAARSKALVTMDGLYLLGFGPRTPDAAHDLLATIYPELGLQPGSRP